MQSLLNEFLILACSLCGLQYDEHVGLSACCRQPYRLVTVPPLITYLTTDDGPTRDAAFLRTYAARVRDKTAASWEIPNSVAQTLEDIAARLEAK